MESEVAPSTIGSGKIVPQVARVTRNVAGFNTDATIAQAAAGDGSESDGVYRYIVIIYSHLAVYQNTSIPFVMRGT